MPAERYITAFRAVLGRRILCSLTLTLRQLVLPTFLVEVQRAMRS